MQEYSQFFWDFLVPFSAFCLKTVVDLHSIWQQFAVNGSALDTWLLRDTPFYAHKNIEV